MSDKVKLTFALMDPPFESANTGTAFRLMDIAAKRGYDLVVFAYEGATALTFSHQKAHANAVHGHNADEEDHPLPKEWVVALQKECEKNGAAMDWINCGLCVDERGVNEAVEGTRRGSPADLWNASKESTNTLIIGTK